jgi:hypothetical protein
MSPFFTLPPLAASDALTTMPAALTDKAIFPTDVARPVIPLAAHFMSPTLHFPSALPADAIPFAEFTTPDLIPSPAFLKAWVIAFGLTGLTFGSEIFGNGGGFGSEIFGNGGGFGSEIFGSGFGFGIEIFFSLTIPNNIQDNNKWRYIS